MSPHYRVSSVATRFPFLLSLDPLQQYSNHHWSRQPTPLSIYYVPGTMLGSFYSVFCFTFTTIRQLLQLPLFYSWGNLRSERLSNLPKVTQMAPVKQAKSTSHSDATPCCQNIIFKVSCLLLFMSSFYGLTKMIFLHFSESDFLHIWFCSTFLFLTNKPSSNTVILSQGSCYFSVALLLGIKSRLRIPLPAC